MSQHNVILITVDSLRADHISCLGYSQKTTPYIDSLADDGALFTNAFSNGGGSVESFPTIMTSTYVLMNPNSNLKNNMLWAKISEKWLTLAELLKKNDYNTVAFVNQKIDLSSVFGYNRGFDIFKEFENNIQGLKGKLYRKINTLIGNKFVRADVINYEVIQWIKKARSPFFLWIHFMDVHSPPNPKNISFLNRIRAFRTIQKISEGAPSVTKKEIRRILHLYDQEIKYLDEQIHMLVSQLTSFGIGRENTYFILLSDHGEQFFEHGEWGHGRLYDYILHVPLIIVGPEIPKKTLIRQQVSLIDIAPTIADLCKTAKPKTFLGKSLLPLIDKDNKNGGGVVISETLLSDYSCRAGEWKYILHFRTQTHELYNLKEDPIEKLNLANQYPQQASTFRKILKKHILNEQKIQKELNEEYANFLKEKQHILKNYPKRNENFITKVLGVPIIARKPADKKPNPIQPYSKLPCARSFTPLEQSSRRFHHKIAQINNKEPYKNPYKTPKNQNQP